MTEGFKSTEFWMAIAVFGLVLFNNSLGLGLSSTDLVATALAVAGYGGARGLAKFNRV